MATAVIMPRQGNTVESCIIAKWHKKKGDEVQVGDVLFTYETDKATFDEEASVSGILLEIYFEEGDDVPVLLNVCVIGNPGESTESFTPGSDVQKPVQPEEREQPDPDEPQVAAPVALQDRDHLKISPRARNLADKKGLDVAFAHATGPGGRVIEKDVLELAKQSPRMGSAAKKFHEPGKAYEGTGIGGRILTRDLEREMDADFVEYEDEKMSNIRKMIARTMHQSLSTMAQLTLNMSFDATALLRFRSNLKSHGEQLGLPNITINDVIIFATSRVLLRHGDLNAHFLEDTMRRFHTVHMGVAVDTPRGLMVPTVRNCQSFSLLEISGMVRDLAAQCKSGTVNPDALKGASFTITTLGAMGVETFTPVINPPQTAILGVCGITTKIRETGGNIVPYQSMGLSLTIDHRAVDGAPGARFLKELCTYLENFEVLLV
ncbi:MAG: dihydrolipoamide acetyltransferase family protein [Clostridia bacterium]